MAASSRRRGSRPRFATGGISSSTSRASDKQGFDAGKDVEFVAPIRPGDEITLSSSVKEIYDKTGRSGTMVFVVIRTTLRNQKGEVVAHVDHRFMTRT